MAAKYRQSSLLEMQLMWRHMQATAARQQTLFQHAESHCRCDLSEWMRQQQEQHQETVAVFSGFLHSVAEAVGPAPTVDAGTDPVVASPGREQGMIARGRSNRLTGHPPKRGIRTRRGGPAHNNL
ncbi:UNVERIFIED_CONTAM: hypothetical protein FKN15_036813 [Acipenser sinensis]